jgi:hypothetical protein
MVDNKPTAPLDLSLFDDLDSAPGRSLTVPPAAQPAVAADPHLAPEPEPERLVEIANLRREDLAAAEAAAAKIDFRNTNREAARQIILLASKGAHEAATRAARSLGGDQRNIDVLAQVADETIKTMQEVMSIEREVAAGDREREAKVAALRDRLVRGMQGVNTAAAQQ